MRRFGPLVLAVLGGLSAWRAFAPSSWWWAAPVGVALLTLAVRGQGLRRAWLLGFAAGLACFLPALHWVTVVGTDAWLLLSAWTALWWGLIGLGTAVVGRLSWWPAAVPLVWVAVEAACARAPLGGWTWGRLGATQDLSALLPWAAIAGVPALTWVTATLGAAGAAGVLALRAVGGRPDPVAAVAAAAGVGIALLGAVWIPVPVQGQSDRGPARVVVGLVQGDVPQSGLDFNAERRAVLDNHVRQTFNLAEAVREGSQPAPELVLWPENASDIDPYRNPDAAAAITAAAASVQVPVLLGAVANVPDDPGSVLNQAVVWDPKDGPGATYVKRNLVPFGEYVPFRDLLAPLIRRFDRIPRDFVAGTRPGGLDVGPTRVGTALCFDVAYDDTMRQTAADGARMLVVQTNNATYNGTGQTWQQLAMSRIRAVEHGRSVVVVSTSGVSAVIDPAGAVVPGTLVGERQARSFALPVAQRDSVTFATAWGPATEAALVLAASSALLLGFITLRRHSTDQE